MGLVMARAIEGPRVTDSEHYLVVDLEGTCDQVGFPRGERETIEIGALLVRASDLKPIQEYQTFVRPIRHPHLTDYCRNLTSISQADVDAAPGFVDAFRGFCTLAPGESQPPLASWGGYDRRQLKRDCDFNGIEFPFEDHIDLSVCFMRNAGLKRRLSMANAMKRVGLDFSGTLHRGIDDARNLVRLMPWALGRNEIPLP